MNLDQLAISIERLRKEAIGEPLWLAEKQVFEYQDHSAKVVAILKLVRAMHGVNSIELLCRKRFFIDSGAIIRCINDCTNEVYFLLEEFPKNSSGVDQFVQEFFGGAIDSHLTDETPQVPTKKIRSAVVRVLKNGHDNATRNLVERIF